MYDNLFDDLLGAGHDSCRRQNAHSAYFGIKPHQTRYVWFVALERIDVQRRGLFNEFFVQLLSSELVVSKPLALCLGTSLQP